MSVWNRIQYPERKNIMNGFRDTVISICIIGVLSLGISSMMKMVV